MSRHSETYRISEIEISYNPKFLVERTPITRAGAASELLRKCYPSNQLEFKEFFYALFLDRSNSPIGYVQVASGTKSSCVVDVAQILAVALKCNASAIIVSHNHPSGNEMPSERDKSLTQKLYDACKLMDITLLDHIIITKTWFYSFRDEGLLAP